MMAGRLVTAALDAGDRADAAELAVRRSGYLADLDKRLSVSLDEALTEDTIAQVALPERDAWAFVDLMAADGRPVRLATVHPDVSKQAVVDELNVHWQPEADDPVGYGAAVRTGRTFALTAGVDAAVAAAAHSETNLALLRELGFAACLVVPVRTDERINGAITFVSARRRTSYTGFEVALAEKIADACGRALRNARMFGAVDERRSAAEDSNRSQADRMAHVTHELRTPLNAIGGYAELMRLGLHGPVTEQQLEDLKRIRWNQQHLQTLITQILSFVRVDTGRVEYEIATIDPGLIFREAVEMLRPLIAGKSHRFRFEGAELGSTLALGDEDKVRQIAINLITNALKYSPGDTEVIVRCGASGASVFAEVADHGAGIAEDQLEAIFEPFTQLAANAAHRGGGVGLGLAIARHLARGMHGDLTVHSVIARGSVFRLSLPAPAAIA